MSRPKFLGGIADAVLRDWAKNIHNLWKSLCIKVMSKAQMNTQLVNNYQLNNRLLFGN